MAASTAPHDLDALLAGLRAALGDGAVRVPTEAEPLAEHLLDWRQRYRGRALAIVLPRSTAEVAQVVTLCARHGASLVPQGGNTSLVGGSVPDTSGHQVVLSLARMRQVLSVDAANLSMTVQAGCVLAQAQEAAAAQDLLFPLSLASEGSCTIGGVLATNAGGTQVLRYGTARELCLGLEVVTAQGEVWHGLKGLRKDNTGYDLRDLIVGSEGTLGIITAATLRLYPRPAGMATALLRCATPADAVALLGLARQRLDASLSACELMAPLPLALVRTHVPEAASVLSAWPDATTDWTVLLECSSPQSDTEATQGLNTVLEQAIEAGWVRDGIVATSTRQSQAMWRLREAIPMAERTEGRMVKHDIGMPTSVVPDFISHMGPVLRTRWPDSTVVCFGHLGDGNLHYNVQPPANARAGEAFNAFEHEVNALVFDAVQQRGGTLSAEHGIGALRKDELARRQDPVAMALMRRIKQVFDPQGVLNPGRVLD